ncbi:MAG TPA: hypothetical protein VJI66_02830 [Candidatus Paceibacterota bacterium]
MKNVILIIMAILVVGGSFVFAEYRNDKVENVYVAPVTADTVDDSASEVDNDSDGMMDWEEILVGSNPNDPKSKGSVGVKSTVTADLTKTSTEKLDPIDLVSRDFFARYMELRQIGISSDKANQEELAARTVGNIVLPQPKSYSLSEIITKTDGSKEAVKQYGSEIGAIFKTYGIKSRNEAIIAKEALEKDDMSFLKEIDPIIVSYKNMINALIQVKAPQSMATMHLDLVNGMNGALFLAQSFRNVESDPVAGLQATSYYQITVDSFGNALRAIKSYFTYLGIYESYF